MDLLKLDSWTAETCTTRELSENSGRWSDVVYMSVDECFSKVAMTLHAQFILLGPQKGNPYDQQGIYQVYLK